VSLVDIYNFDLQLLICFRALKRFVQLLKDGQAESLYPIYTRGPVESNDGVPSVLGDLGAGHCVIAYDECSTFKVGCSYSHQGAKI
jgi:hypothetical protein